MANRQTNIPSGDMNRGHPDKLTDLERLPTRKPILSIPPFSVVRKNKNLDKPSMESLGVKKPSGSVAEKFQHDPSASDSEASLPEHLKIKFNNGNMLKSLHHSIQFPLQSDSSDDDIDIAIRRMKYRMEMDYLATKLNIPSSEIYDSGEQVSEIEEKPRWVRVPDWEQKLMKDPPKTWHDKREDKNIYRLVTGRPKNKSEKEKQPLPYSTEWEENLLKPEEVKQSKYQRRIEKREKKMFSAWLNLNDGVEHPLQKHDVNGNGNVEYQRENSNKWTTGQRTESNKHRSQGHKSRSTQSWVELNSELKQRPSVNIPEQSSSGKALLNERNYGFIPREVGNTSPKIHGGIHLETKPPRPPRGPKFTYDGIIHTVKPKMPLPRDLKHLEQIQTPPSRAAQVSQFPNLEHRRPPKPRSMKSKTALNKQKTTKKKGGMSKPRGYRRPRPSTGVKNCQAAAEAAVRSYLARRDPTKLAPGAAKQPVIHKKPKKRFPACHVPAQVGPKQNLIHKPLKHLPSTVKKSPPVKRGRNGLVPSNQNPLKKRAPKSHTEAIAANKARGLPAAQNKNSKLQSSKPQGSKFGRGFQTRKAKAVDALPPPIPPTDTRSVKQSYDWDHLEPPPFIPPPEKKEIIRRGRKTYDWVLPQHESKPYAVRKPSFIDTTPEFHPYYTDMKKEKEQKPLSSKEILAQEECFQKIDKTLNEYIRYKAMRDARDIPFVANNEPFPRVSSAARLVRKSSKIKSED